MTIQMNFWVFSYTVFTLILYFVSKAITSLYPQDVDFRLWENILMAFIVGIFFGSILGLVDFVVEKRLRGRSLGIELLIKGASYLATWYLVAFLGYSIDTLVDIDLLESPLLSYSPFFSENMFIAASIYTAVMVSVMSFIKQMNNKFGPGVLIPMLLGKYRKPEVQERVFLFMDLKDSTTYAERLGHLKYSKMIQDCFMDVNRVIPTYYAEIYQYVGDEVVLSWASQEGLSDRKCIEMFFAFQQQLRIRKEHYESSYGFVPQFKAGANLGDITVAEVGEYKRDIAYHGDTINTAARIRSVCNTYGKSFIISEHLKDQLEWVEPFESEFLDSIRLTGKEQEVKLYSVTPKVSPGSGLPDVRN
jgi:adenylate cyclase